MRYDETTIVRTSLPITNTELVTHPWRTSGGRCVRPMRALGKGRRTGGGAGALGGVNARELIGVHQSQRLLPCFPAGAKIVGQPCLCCSPYVSDAIIYIYI